MSCVAIMTEERAIEKLESVIVDFQKASLSDATRAAYKADWEAFCEWCSLYRVHPLPAAERTILSYFAELGASGRSVSTIIRAATSINKAHVLAGHESIRSPGFSSLLLGIKKRTTRNLRKAKGISYVEICKMTAHCSGTSIGIRDKAILWIGWCGALRRSEIVAIDVEDLDFTPSGVILTIRRSKTDQEGKGKKIAIPYASDQRVCPVNAIEAWIIRASLKSGPLFRRIGMSGVRTWFAKTMGGRLTDRTISNVVRKYARLSGLNETAYSPHSLRRGLATEAASRGVPDRIIARQTRHASLSSLAEYIEEGSIWLENPLSAIYSPRESE